MGDLINTVNAIFADSKNIRSDQLQDTYDQFVKRAIDLILVKAENLSAAGHHPSQLKVQVTLKRSDFQTTTFFDVYSNEILKQAKTDEIFTGFEMSYEPHPDNDTRSVSFTVKNA